MLTALALILLSSSVIAYDDPHCLDGRDGIVHLFEWTWDDIAAECESFLGPYGFCAVQTSPVSENRIITEPNRPWYERYQPVSYKFQSRSGNALQFKRMVKICAEHGVRVYADVVINHMTGSGGQGNGTGGSFYDADTPDFPEVPYRADDFHDGEQCHTSDLGIHSYSNAEEVRNCRLVGLLDLNMEKNQVRYSIANYLNHLLRVGVAGFRVDAAKHMWPQDLVALLERVKDVNWGGRPFVYQEVIDHGGEAIKAEEYFATGKVTNFKFGRELARVFRHTNAFRWLVNWGKEWGMWDSEKVINFIDNHDTQRYDSDVLTHWESRAYKMATAFMLAHPYGMPRIMSSYEYNRANNYEGPPHNDDMSIRSVTFSPLNEMVCEGGWTCEHRWRQIYNMVAFRNMARGTGVDNWWVGSDYQIAFSRGDKAFIAFNLEDWDINTTLQTGLPPGTYCDIITGNLEGEICTGRSVIVNEDGTANINVCTWCEDPVLAIHVGAKIGSPPRRY